MSGEVAELTTTCSSTLNSDELMFKPGLASESEHKFACREPV